MICDMASVIFSIDDDDVLFAVAFSSSPSAAPSSPLPPSSSRGVCVQTSNNVACQRFQGQWIHDGSPSKMAGFGASRQPRKSSVNLYISIFCTTAATGGKNVNQTVPAMVEGF